jgi:hypothetical protein
VGGSLVGGAHLSGNQATFREQAVKLSFLKEDSPISKEMLFEYFAFFYEPFESEGQTITVKERSHEMLQVKIIPAEGTANAAEQQ